MTKKKTQATEVNPQPTPPMNNPQQLTQISKFLSLVLRHQPETIGLELDRNGWANVEELLEKSSKHGIAIHRALLVMFQKVCL